MSQFFGCISLSSNVNLIEIETKMSQAMAFFDPDVSGVFRSSETFICNKHLFNSTESRNASAICQTERYVLAASCRIDNREELYQKLSLTGDIFGEQAISDQEYILKTYEKYQEECVKHLIGDFSFVIWDKQEQKLFMAKDHLGIKPLFYLLNDDILVFSTSIIGIKAAFKEHLPIDQLYVAYNLKNCPPPVDLTFFEDIHRLQPAHTCVFFIEKGLKPEIRYWDLEALDISTFKTDDERLMELRRLFEQAVKSRTRTTKNIGCQLSGGLDSSAIAVLASRMVDKSRLHTYSFVLNNKTRGYSKLGIDEQDTQKTIIDYATLKTANHHPIEEFHFKDVYEEMEYSNRILGGYANSDTIWQASLFKEAKKNDVGISFSGFPGDECVSNSGQRFYYEYFYHKDFKKIVSLLVDYKLRAIKWMVKYVISKIKGYDIRTEKRDFLKADSPFQNTIKTTFGVFYPSFKKYLKAEITRAHTCLRTESEGAYALVHGIETVYPLADIRLVTFAYSLPVEMFKPKPLSRMLFRNLCTDILPKSVRTQPKNNGAMTLAFAEFWKEKQWREFQTYGLQDSFHMFSIPDEINHNDFTQKLDLVKLYKADFLIEKNK